MKTLELNPTVNSQISKSETWDETDVGKAIIIKLLEKSQQDSKEGKGRPIAEFKAEMRLKYSHLRA